MISPTAMAFSASPRSSSTLINSRNVSMPTSLPFSITTNEPISSDAMECTASATLVSGDAAKSVLPLMRRISLTSMVVLLNFYALSGKILVPTPLTPAIAYTES